MEREYVEKIEKRQKDKIKDTEKSQINIQKDTKEETCKETNTNHKIIAGKIREEANGNSNPNEESKIKEETNKKAYTNSNLNVRNRNNNNNLKFHIIFILSVSILLISIIIYIIFFTPKENLIDNNFEQNIGIVKVIDESANNKISIKKEVLKTVKNFIACIGTPGSGKSTFGSNYYKYLYHVKNDYFESSNSELTFTKGIWMVSDEERRKIPKYINKDILDVEGFEIDENKSWKFVMIIAFLSSDLILLNRNPRLDNIRKIINIIQNYLEKMLILKLPRILKNIYIQVNEEPNKSIEELLDVFKINKTIFEGIKFKYIYLPNIQGKPKDLMKVNDYRINFEKIINILTNDTNDYNSVSSLLAYIDNFNKAIKAEILFQCQDIFKDMKNEFEGIYKKIYYHVKYELSQKESDLKRPTLNETFEDFINKQTNLNFYFDIKNTNFTFYGSGPDYDDYYEKLKKKKSFKIDPKDVFLDFYNIEILKLRTKESKEKEILNLYIQKKKEIDSYFNSLQFHQTIEEIDLGIKVEIDLDFKNEREKDLKNYFNNKKLEKEKEWKDQIQRAKWKMPVQATGSSKCPNGHKFRSDDVFCSRCHENIYWVDGDTDYVICKGCESVRKINEPFICGGCGAKLPDKLKRIPGYKP